jgi:hypothetical protein
MLVFLLKREKNGRKGKGVTRRCDKDIPTKRLDGEDEGGKGEEFV